MRHGHELDETLNLSGWSRDTDDEGTSAPFEMVEAAVVESARENVHAPCMNWYENTGKIGRSECLPDRRGCCVMSVGRKPHT